MRVLNAQEAGSYLNTVGMKIDDWNRLCEASGREFSQKHRVRYQAPKGARELYNFAQDVASWLPSASWKLLQIDNSTWTSDDEEFLVKRLLFPSTERTDLPPTILFEVASRGADEELLLANLIYLFLLFEYYADVVSSDSRNGKHIWICDGFVYFCSFDDNDLVEARALLTRFENTAMRVGSRR
jgi:hypothetical protein